MSRILIALALALALALIAAGCGSDDDDTTADDTTTTTTADDTTTTTADDTTTSSTADDTTTTTTSGDGTDDGTDGDLPGEPFDGFTSDGDLLSVVGVAYDDVLNVRAVPGTSADIVATAEPTADDLVATGRARSLPDSIWYEVTVGGATGWVGSRFVAFEGATDDATAEFLDGGPPIEAETMVDLAQPVIEFYASEDPPSNVVQSVEASVGDLGEITYDVIGIGDDAVAGYRLHIFGMPTAGGESFVLDSIERTYFCSRGVSGEFCA
jgi:hypothetical protein